MTEAAFHIFLWVMAAVAVVGEGLKYAKGIAGRLFTILGRNGIGVLACAQGSSDYNISLVVEQKYLRKSLNVIHDSFFLSEYQELNLFICGIGTVGGSLIGQIRSQRERLMRERNLKLNIVGIARSTKALFNRDGVDSDDYRQRLDTEGMDITPSRLRNEVIGMNIFNSVFVDCTASPEIAALYKDFFVHGVSVVTANKIAASSDYANYKDLKDTALKRGVKFLFETNVGAGLPVINTINALKNSGDRIEKIEAVLSGTLNFIFNTISAEVPFSKTVRMAQEQGFSEPDPRIDLSGKDVIRKLVILAREAGYQVEQSDVEAHLFVPDDFFANTFHGSDWIAMPAMVLIGFPMYVCSMASIPIAASLILKGLSPGAAFVFLMVGPAMNAMSVTTVSSLIGRKATAAYVATIALGAVVCGIVINLIPDAVPVVANASCCGEHGPSPIQQATAVFLAAMMLYDIVKPFGMGGRKAECKCHCHGHDGGHDGNGWWHT